jgi:tight adherence protein B
VTAAAVTAALVVAVGGALRLALLAGRRARVVRRFRDPTGDPAGIRMPAFAPMTAPPRLASALADAAIDIAPDTAFSLWCAAVPLAAVVALVVAGPVPGAGAVIAGVTGPLVLLHSRRGRADARLESQLPAGLEAVARALRSGASLRQAVEEAAGRTPGRLGDELGRVAVQAARGYPLVGALEAMARRRPLPGVRLAVAALCLGAETGGTQARAVDGVATTLRDRLGVAAEVKALSAQARMSALVMSVAPLAFGAFAAATDPRTAAFLFHTMAGSLLLGAGALLDGAGWLWMSRLSRVAA